mmetsp:Transcript_29099/g.25737  ORF Transcript_29099/g.25737 Transcript_29099/m.25737 type:complete len:126 (+) Transcript_29099:33-410(+)
MRGREMKQKCYQGRTLTFSGYSCLNFDFNEQVDENTLEILFCKSNTNDAGEPLLPQTAQYILGEFRKYLSNMVAACLRAQNRTFYKDIYSIDGQRYYSFENTTSIYFDRALKHFLLHNFERYSEF